MGVFDSFDVPDCDGQVKTYSRVLDTYRVGDRVDNKDLPSNHSIKLRGGQWVNIEDNIYIGYTSKPTQDQKYDKWGHVFVSDEHNYRKR